MTTDAGKATAQGAGARVGADWVARVEGPGGERDVPVTTSVEGGRWRATIEAPHGTYDGASRSEGVAVMEAVAAILTATSWRLVSLARGPS